MKIITLFLISLLYLCPSQSTSLMTLLLVDNTVDPYKTSACLDGTAPGYYFRASQSSSASNKWVISIFGGGWCYTNDECLQRSKTQLGSNKLWPKEINGTGILSGSSNINPDFYNWNSIYIIYCDGASFSGNVKDPVKVNNEYIYYRGKYNLDAVINHLKANYHFDSATHVILTGCSAGGLSTFLHADYLATMMPKNAVYKALPQSGFFLPSENIEHKPVYINQMKTVFNIQNVSINVNQDCIKNFQAKQEEWKCMFAPYTYPFIKTNIMVLDSTYDSWSMYNIFGAGVTSFVNCAAHGPVQCNSTEITLVNAWRTALMTFIKTGTTFNNPKNGAFLNSCWSHCASYGDQFWSSFKISGVTLNKAVADWFFEKSTKNNHVDCILSTSQPHRCNNQCSPN